MKKGVFIAWIVTAFVLVGALGAFSVVQSVKCSSLQQKEQQTEQLNQNLCSQVNTMNSSLSSLESALKAETDKAQRASSQQAALSSSKAESTAAVSSNTTSTGKVAYLTFDDGPSYNTPRLLDILKENDIKATFFVIADSEDTPQKRAWMKREVDEGHTIAIHSWSHEYSYIYANESNFLTDFNKIKNMVVSATGVEPKFFRFPGGTDNTVSLTINKGKPIMPTLVNDVLNLGMTPVDWNAGGMDAVIPVPSKETLVNGVVDDCRYLKSAVILLHDSDPHASSVAAVPEIITKLRAMGFTFKPLTSSDQAFRRNPALRRTRK